MSARIAGLLLKAAQQLPPLERDELLTALISGALTLPAAEHENLDPWQVDLPGPGEAGGPVAGRSPHWAITMQPLGTRDSLGGPVPGGADAALKVLPVRLPVTDYDRLRAFSRQHGFSMAVIIRTLVERFLDGQARRWASRRDEPDDASDDLDDGSTAGHA